MRFRHGTAQCAASAASDGSTSGAQPWAARAQSGIHGWGLFARAALAQDSMVIEFRGELMRRATADARERRYRAAGRDCYLFNVNEDTVVDATLRGTIGRFTVGSLVCHRMDTTISHICCLFSFTDKLLTPRCTAPSTTVRGALPHCSCQT